MTFYGIGRNTPSVLPTDLGGVLKILELGFLGSTAQTAIERGQRRKNRSNRPLEALKRKPALLDDRHP